MKTLNCDIKPTTSEMEICYPVKTFTSEKSLKTSHID